MVKKQTPQDKANKLKEQAKQKMQEAKRQAKDPRSMSDDMETREEHPRSSDTSRGF
ncbi:hypothetical protein ABZZ20_04405 [Streptomyces sp. NPDC006430]|uniref:hypothetical protein n=1 Tax=Streptomyces sp. NPDC006430 TaxID=3154299 RepID=UPI0033BE9CC8